MEGEGESGHNLEQELRAEVRTSILAAEDEFNKQMERISGFERAVQALQGLEAFVKEQDRKMQDSSDMRKFVRNSRTYLDEMINRTYEDDTFEFDFGTWADELESDIRNQNPSMISMASEFEGSFSGDIQSTNELHRQGGSHQGRGRDKRGPESMKSFLHLLQTNGAFENIEGKLELSKEDKKTYMWATYMAWTVAVLGMIIALSFLTRDFYIAHTNYAIHIDRKNLTVPYPALTVCAHTPGLPFFSDYPTDRYPGLPLLGISQIVIKDNEGKQKTIVYPNTLPGNRSYVEEVFSGSNSQLCKNPKKATSLKNDQMALFKLGDVFNPRGGLESRGSSCYWCLRIGGTNSIIAPNRNLESSGPSSPPFHVTFFQSKFSGGCKSIAGFRDKTVRRLFAEQLRLHSNRLIALGVLNFADYPPNNKKYDALNTIVLGFKHNSRNGLGDYIAGMEFACNVYFYTGYFYPTVDKPDIRYKFNFAIKSWVKVGKGPYFSARSWAPTAPDLIGPGHDAVEKDLYSMKNSQILFEDPTGIATRKSPNFVPLANKISHIEVNTAQFIDVERLNVRGVIEYRTRVQEIGTQKLEAKGVSGFSVALSYKNIMTEEITSIATVGWSQYVTDLFEFIGLFTGVCVFTLLVAPAHSIVTTGGDSQQLNES